VERNQKCKGDAMAKTPMDCSNLSIAELKKLGREHIDLAIAYFSLAAVKAVLCESSPKTVKEKGNGEQRNKTANKF
jgi:hypothetical protein